MRKNPHIRTCACSACGHDARIERWNTEKEGATCLKCHIEALRKAVKQIHEGIDLIYKALSKPQQLKMEIMTSQRKKLLYFQALESGMIQWKIK